MNRKRAGFGVGLLATAAVSMAMISTSAGGDTVASSPSCDQTYDGTTFSQTCAIPHTTDTVTETNVVPGPTVISTVPGPTTTVTVSPSSSPAPDGPVVNSLYPTVVFYDTFTTPAVDTTKWNVRNNSYASNELSIDTNRPSNVFVSDSKLTLRAQRETYTTGSVTRDYTSGYVDTIGKGSWSPPLRVDARMQLPEAKGMWPALWMRGNTPALGEIDIFEAVGGWAKAAMTVHQSTNGDMAKIGYEWQPPAGWRLSDWHDYAFEWDANGTMRWYVDGNLIITRTTSTLDNKGTPASWLTGSTFAAPFNLRLNLQVGGSMPNYYKFPVDDTSQLPADMRVEYITVRTK
jgi:beta-glucanase (GH16 family)